MRVVGCVVLCGCLVVTVAGCRSPAVQADFQFDARGWGGPDLKYALDPSTNTITVHRGMLVNEDFRWAESRFSFEFRDRSDLVWGLRLLDRVFRGVRRADLRNTRTVVKTGPRTFVSGKDLPPDERWRLWKYDRMLDVAFVSAKKGTGYKVLGGWWYEHILGDGLAAVKVEGAHDVRIKRNAWNTFSASTLGGKFTYTLNGRPGSGSFQLDRRTNGRLGIFVKHGGPLCIRNLKFLPLETVEADE